MTEADVKEKDKSYSLCEDDFARLEKFIKDLKIDKEDERRSGNLISVLHKAQIIFGFLPVEVQKFIASSLGVAHSEVSGVISFYNYFTTVPRGKIKISVCMGTACFVKGASKILSEFERYLKISAGEVTEDGKFSIDILRCVGACGLAPVVMVNDRIYGNVTPKKVGDIMAEYINLEALNET